MRLSVVIPAQNEAGSIGQMLERTASVLDEAQIDYELLVVDDASTDETPSIVHELGARNTRIRYLRSTYAAGFGLTVRCGLEAFDGDAVCVMIADASDSPEDLLEYHRLLEHGYDCAFGSRFISGSHVDGYPWFKLAINRMANTFIRIVFRHGYNDTTNAFKVYRREMIGTVQPLLSHHFNLTVELPLKAVVRGHTYGIVPIISWTNRQHGVSKLRLQERGNRYLFIVLYVFLERHLSRGDYCRPDRRQGPLRPGLRSDTPA